MATWERHAEWPCLSWGLELEAGSVTPNGHFGLVVVWGPSVQTRLIADTFQSVRSRLLHNFKPGQAAEPAQALAKAGPSTL